MNKTKLDPLILGLSSPIIMSIENINFCIGLPLNICVILLLTRAGGLDGSVMFTLSQAATEILLAIPAPLFILCYVNVENLCFYYPLFFIFGTCLSSRVFFQCCVCAERYVAVVHPVTYLKYKNMTYRLAVSGVVWLYSFGAGTVFILKLSDLPFGIFAIFYCMILSAMLFCSFSLLRGLRRPGPGARKRDDGGVSVAKKKAFKVVSLNFLIFLIQTIPVVLAFGVRNILSDNAFILAFMIALNIAISVNLLQPVIFLYQNGQLMCMS